MSYHSDMKLIMTSLSQIAAEGKPVEVDQGMLDYMGIVPDPAVSETDDDDLPLAA